MFEEESIIVAAAIDLSAVQYRQKLMVKKACTASNETDGARPYERHPLWEAAADRNIDDSFM